MSEGRALVLSPFATHPLDAGQRKRAFQTTKLLQDLGFRITFLHYAFETRWYWGHNEDDDMVLRQQWGDVLHFYGHKGVGMEPKDGPSHALDEWWDQDLGGYLENLFCKRRFDLFVVHNVWLSKAFDHAPETCVKALETHDVFSARAEQFRATGVSPEFFSCSVEDEVFGLNRADLLIAIKEEDAAWYTHQKLKPSISVLTLPYLDPEVSSFSVKEGASGGYLHPAKVRFGMIGSDIHFNRIAIENLIRELDKLVRETYAPVEVVLAGSICRSVADHTGLVTKLGFVKEVSDFYDTVDAVVVPMLNGTGVKIKSVEAIRYKKPVLLTEHSAEGTYHQGIHARNLHQMAERMVAIALLRPDLTTMLSETEVAIQRALAELEANSRSLLRQMKQRRTGFLQVARAVTHTGEPSAIDRLVHLCTYRLLGSWFRPLGLVTDATTADSIDDVPGDSLTIVHDRNELERLLELAGVVVIDGRDQLLLEPLLRQALHVTLIIDLRLLEVEEAKDLQRSYGGRPNVLFLVNPLLVGWWEQECPACSQVALPLLNDRLTWDPHLTCHRDVLAQLQNGPPSNATSLSLSLELAAMNLPSGTGSAAAVLQHSPLVTALAVNEAKLGILAALSATQQHQ
ncbi:glycosyltransferase family 4 protein [Synechococcus sp. CCY 9618]|uniref:glycosyltransferase family 4 protein n=1 Tax=Synechococcus sp. CCY 9618 TaxID=2815602 RepID=UPI001C21C244|nr:glycosyltransferase family 4 protein [Synechococcus sp. CCY 9618]